MKKTIALLLAAVLCISLVACAQPAQTGETTKATQETTPETVPASSVAAQVDAENAPKIGRAHV